MGLREYIAKRNFGRTEEPTGGTCRSARVREPMFVIQKHAASHLHYDFRLEMDGVLKSWAVPKGIPLKRGDRRLAVEVEDHPLDYGNVEGTIPEGNYGAGTVMVWDTGTYQVLGGEPLEQLKNGKIHFVLSGNKLKGEWTLVRMRPRPGERKPQWMLLKSGEDHPEIPPELEYRSVLSGRSMEEIALGTTPSERTQKSGKTLRGPRVRVQRQAVPRSKRSVRSARTQRRAPASKRKASAQRGQRSRRQLNRSSL